MDPRRQVGWTLTVGLALAIVAAVGVTAPFARTAEQAAVPGDVTYTKDIAPILQRSCENCHRADSVAPMMLTTYEEVRPWARAIKRRTGVGPRAGVMPPWYVEKNIGIQHFKSDPSLSEDEIAKIAKWADSGAPRGDPADMPPPRTWNDATKWKIGTPDLIYESEMDVCIIRYGRQRNSDSDDANIRDGRPGALPQVFSRPSSSRTRRQELSASRSRLPPGSTLAISRGCASWPTPLVTR